MAVTKEALAIVFDVGKSKDKIFIEAKRCISMIVQRKIFSESKDEIALILLGTSDTDNITVVQELQLASWELLKSISEVKCTGNHTDYIRDEALLAAIRVFQNTFIGKKFFSRRILFLSCFDGSIYSNKVDEICEELKKQKIDLNVIGPVAFPAEGIIKNGTCHPGYVTLPEKRGPVAFPAEGIIKNGTCHPGYVTLPEKRGPVAFPAEGIIKNGTCHPGYVTLPEKRGPVASPAEGIIKNGTCHLGYVTLPEKRGPVASPAEGIIKNGTCHLGYVTLPEKRGPVAFPAEGIIKNGTCHPGYVTLPEKRGPVASPAEGIIKNGTCHPGYVTLPEKRLHCITKILKEVNGVSYSFSDVLPVLIDFQKKKVQAIPWNANLDIGTNLSIPISAYIKVCENKPKPWKDAYAFKVNAKITRGTSYFNECQSAVTIIDGFPCLTKDVSDLFNSGFKYGTTLVPCSEEDKVNMDYQSGEKGMKVLGFTKAENVERYHYIGDKTMYVFGQKNRELAGVILAPLIHALYETKMVAIVRYVYSQKSAPKIGFLTPKIKENYECLIFVALPFMEDLRHFQFSPLDSNPKNVPTEQQLSAVDELITAMDLTDPVSCEDEEILKPKNTINPHLQHLYESLEFRALNPEKPLPGVDPHIEALVTPDPKLLKRAEPSLRKIKSLFPTKILESDIGYQPFPNRKSEEDYRKELIDLVREEKPVSDADRIVEVGSVNPVRDFQYLINNKVLPFNDICQQLMDVVVKFLQDNAHLRMYHSKILSMCKEFRSAALKEGDPVKYNCFMKNLRNVLLECDEELWSKVKNEKIGLISDCEIPTCAVSVQQAEMFLANHPHSADKSAVTLIESFDANDEYGNLLDQL